MNKWTTKSTQHILPVVLTLIAVLGLIWFTWPSVVSARERLPTVSGERLTELVRVSVWPMLVFVALVVFRRQLRAFADAIGSRASRVSILNLEIELAQSAQLTGWPAPAIQGIKEADGAVVAYDSSASLFQELHGTAADFAVVNLGQGEEWLTSRIYILATLLRRMRSIRAIVFLMDSQAHKRLFLGVVLPEDLRTRFDFYYPWMGECLLTQYKHLPRPPMGPPPEKLDVFDAQRILGFYIEDLRKRPEDVLEEEWTEIRPEVSEHARWVDGPGLARVLGSSLQRSAIRWKPTLGQDDTRDILGKQGDFVALVDGEGVFRDTLVDRRFMIESVAKEIAAHE